MRLPSDVINKIKDFDAVADDNRFSILISLRSSDVLKTGEHSCTPTQLSQITSLSEPNISYHLNFLLKRNIISKTKEGSKKSVYYHITEKGIKLLDLVGLTEKKIIELNKKSHS